MNAHDADQQTGWAWIPVKKGDWWYCSLHRADEKKDPGWVVVVETTTGQVVRRMLKDGLERWVVWVADDGYCCVNVVDGQQQEVTP